MEAHGRVEFDAGEAEKERSAIIALALGYYVQKRNGNPVSPHELSELRRRVSRLPYDEKKHLRKALGDSALSGEKIARNSSGREVRINWALIGPEMMQFTFGCKDAALLKSVLTLSKITKTPTGSFEISEMSRLQGAAGRFAVLGMVPEAESEKFASAFEALTAFLTAKGKYETPKTAETSAKLFEQSLIRRSVDPLLIAAANDPLKIRAETRETELELMERWHDFKFSDYDRSESLVTELLLLMRRRENIERRLSTAEEGGAK